MQLVVGDSSSNSSLWLLLIFPFLLATGSAVEVIGLTNSKKTLCLTF